MKNLKVFASFLLLFLIACKGNIDNKTEKFQKHHDKTVNVNDEIINIKSDIIFGLSKLYILDSFLIVSELRPAKNKVFHLFNKNNFNYVTSTGIRGKGPGEIVNSGGVCYNEKKRIFLVPDYGKMVIWEFHLDSVLNNEMYKPIQRACLEKGLFLNEFQFLNDSIVIGNGINPLSNSTYEMVMLKFNLNSNKTEKFGYTHPKAIGRYKSNSYFALSYENNMYVNCYSKCDLMTICDINGNLKHNIYGPDCFNNEDNKKTYYRGVSLIDNYIIAGYLGEVNVSYDEYKRPNARLMTKVLVYDIQGNYKKTIEIGNKIQCFCVDKEKKRIIAYFEERKEQLGYFNLNLE